jgi:multiple sugar transport system substrate-binding protein
MITKRAIVLLLALLLPILVACGGGGDGGGEAAPSPATGGAETSPEAETVPETSTSAAGGEEVEPPDVTGTAAEEDVEATPEATDTAGQEGGEVTEIDWSALAVEEGAQLRFLAPGNPTEQQLYQQGAQRFSEIFADQNVTMSYEPVPAEYETTITAAFSGGNAPDVFLLNGELMGALAPQGLLLPLDNTMQQVGVEPSAFYEPLLELFQQDGKTYGLPKDFNPLVLFINTDMAQQAGVDPANIQTWNDLKEAAQAMTQGEGAGKVYGMCLTPDIQRYGASMFQNGNPIIENNQAVFNQESGVEAIQLWKDMQEAGTAATFRDLGNEWCGEAFAQQTAAMAVEGGWLVPFMADPQQGGQDVNYTAIPLPIPEGGEQATWLFTNAFAANANTQYPQAAAAAVLYLTSPENQQELIPTGLAQPSLKALADDPYYQENEVAQVLVEAAENGRVADVVLGGSQKKADVLRIINQQGMEPIFLGQAEVQQALDQAAQGVNDVLQR